MLEPRKLGVYVVTSDVFGEGRDHRSIATAAIAGGASAVQLRAPGMPDADLCLIAAEIAAMCRRADLLFIVNDRLEVALESGADGVHVGHDADPAFARARIGGDRILGVSVGDAGEAVAAEVAGADYLGVTVWATTTKPDACPRGLDGLKEVVDAASIPVVGIGGIFPSNARLVLEAGAAGVAVVSAVGAAVDPVAATVELVSVVERFRSGEGMEP